ncbi:MAG: NeuD/PglB/VioB family sugar acetyltransferase [Paludibacteraceae bacterium]|nr:NeuD/PglB/VioB family sugar acetyltransferase [Paludibacteraceae bacterium]
MKPIILIGGGGHCKSVIEAIGNEREILGILDKPELVGQKVLDIPVIGCDDDMASFASKADFIITIGFIKNAELRIRLYDSVKNCGGHLATVIASTAHVSKHATIGEGTVVMHRAFVNAGAVVGDNVILNTFCNIEHDAVIGNQCHISTGVMVNGDCRVGHNVFVGSGSVLANGISISDNIVVGAGSLVRKTLRTPGIYSGNPAILKIRAK